MILSVHFVTGAALSPVIQNPLLLAPAAMALHLALDILPHWEYDFLQTSKKKAALKIAADLAMGGALVFILGRGMPADDFVLAIFGGFFGILPDGITALYLASKKKLFSRFTRIHIFFHALFIPENEHPPAWLGILSQGIVVMFSIIMLFPR